jgi:purine-nucleoside phosphorylase
MNHTFDPQAYRRDLEESVAALKNEFGGPPDLAIVFGSGLGHAFREAFPGTKSRLFSAIPHLLPPHVEGHAGEAYRVYGSKKGSASAMILQGRIHYYEGLAPERIVLPVRALALWGVKRLVLTNAAGSLRERLRAGRLVRISDHLNLTGGNPLCGPNLDFLGTRFPSLEGAYENDFSKGIDKIARGLKMTLAKGVYVGIAGPSYETEAEIRAYRILGGDLIGMSTVYETIAATHAGMQVAALSAVTNSCLKRKHALNHEEVLANAKQVDGLLAKLLRALLEKGVA